MSNEQREDHLKNPDCGGEPTDTTTASSQQIALLLESDMDCYLEINGEDQGQLDKNTPRRFVLPAGSNLINAVTQDGLVEKEWVQASANEEVTQHIYLAKEHTQAQTKLREQKEELNGPLGIECWSVEQIQLEQMAAAKEAGLATVFRDGPDTPEMVVIPAGSYRMGEASNKHKVAIARPFAVGKYPVTVADWKRFVVSGETAYSPADNGWAGDNLPVTNVNFLHAQAYVRWLSKQTGKSYRLLSEAEWEYACRAGSLTEYYWGDELGKNNCNCQDSKSEWSCKRASPVGSFAPNGFGLYDMLGNVWEWVEDTWHDTYRGAPADGSAWSSGGAISTLSNQEWRVLRGGSWIIDPRDARSAVRFMSDQSSRDSYTGFRIARTLL
ncbi:formylglycine-generating enzyme family protein [Candidatus Nitrotoga sp. M5]|uniref:formylglycine-generating enzyme family protein n=1 Tax=Candidatus Nitrotoga sp. M5 TaxID=2890409 RepID=UPI001EF16F7E|nr:formylglycine-generating enzyme family protein [Candidatus Nitrotoga sp. M5]CAH1385521.1 Formylglycine-generating enzyme, required for sulfatase activity, contains SUMF1/FGE domain [Candidatus Nitrotoga sp. M5]